MLKLIASVGASGSGKSTFLLKLSKELNIPIVCSDDIRQEICGDASCQDRNAEVFLIAKKRLVDRLKNNEDVIMDSTAYNEKNRKMLNDLASQYNAELEWHVFQVPIETLVKRQDLRDRKVPVDVIERQHANMTMPTTGKIIQH